MFIAGQANSEPKPRRGEMCKSLDEPTDDPHSAPTERRYISGCVGYKHFVPTGLVLLVFCVLLVSLFRDSHVFASSTAALCAVPPLHKASADPQDQNIHFSKLLHNN